MIHRIVIILLLLILLPDLYRTWYRHRKKLTPRPVRSGILWGITLLISSATLVLANSNGFQSDPRWLADLYLWVLGLYVIPRFAMSFCTAVGRLFRPLSRRRRNWGRPIGLIIAIASLYIFIYGMTIGPRQLTVKQTEMTFADLPNAFNGYRLVVISDLHLGSQHADFVEKVVNTVNDQQPDAICFLGDLQNSEPQEIYPYTTLLRSLKAHDGVFSILGNHDYSYYIGNKDDAVRAANERETIARERQAGWTVLLNESHDIERKGQCIRLVGTENYSDRPQHQPSRADLRAACQKGLGQGTSKPFVILMQHNPLFWRAEVSRQADIPLTLSGHTHGGQLKLFGYRASAGRYREDCGLYTQGHQRLFVTTGLGGLVPFRFNMPPEIVIITLKTV